MRRYPLHGAVSLAGLLLLSGCTVVPGMNYNGNVPESFSEYVGISGSPLGDDASGPEGYTVQRITPALIGAEREIRLRGQTEEGGAPLKAQIADYRYLVGAGDVLSVMSWTDINQTATQAPPVVASLDPSAAFSSLQQAATAAQQSTPAAAGFKVDSTGAIFYPYVGSVPVAGKTIAEVRTEIAAGAKPMLRHPQISVDVTQFNSQKYQINGVVMHPGLYPVTDVPLTVSQAIAAAGGVVFLIPNAIQNGNTIPRPLGDLSHVVFTHDNRVSLLDIRARLEDGNASEDRLVSAGDIIDVPDNSQEQVHVIGEVNVPGNVALDDGRLNLSQALGDVGSLNLTTANFARIFVFRGAYSERKIYWLDARSPDAMLLANGFMLEPQDVIYVASTDTAQWNRVISQILPTVDAMYETKVLLGK